MREEKAGSLATYVPLQALLRSRESCLLCYLLQGCVLTSTN